MEVETYRLKFYFERDGLEAMQKFATESMRRYRRAVLTNGKRFDGKKAHFASNPDFKRGFIQSYLEFKRAFFNPNEVCLSFYEQTQT